MICLLCWLRVAQFVEFGVEAVANDSGIGGERRRLVRDGISRRSRTSASSSISWWRWRSKSLPPFGGAVRKFLSVGSCVERFAQRDEFARRCQAERDAACEAFEIEDASELFADFAADYGLLDELRDGAVTRFDGFAIDERAKEPRAHQTRAHACDRHVERGEQRRRSAAAGFFVEDRIDEFEIANGDGIED